MKNVVKKIIPTGIKKRIYNELLLLLKDKIRKESSLIPRFNFEGKHISNTQLLNNRITLLHRLPKHGVVGELGVDMGDFSEKIIEICSPQKLHLIDSWGSKRYHKGKQLIVENRFKKEIDQALLEINSGKSIAVVNQFPDSYFDWIYIDTDHTYKTTSSELDLYRPKMKPNGIICGHDYIIGNWDGMLRYGVMEAVSEFCHKYDWELLYLTTELDSHPSFAIGRLNTDTNKG